MITTSVIKEVSKFKGINWLVFPLKSLQNLYGFLIISGDIEVHYSLEFAYVRSKLWRQSFTERLNGSRLQRKSSLPSMIAPKSMLKYFRPNFKVFIGFWGAFESSVKKKEREKEEALSAFPHIDRSSRLKAFCKEVVLINIFQNSQKNTCARVSFLIKLQTWGWDLRPGAL